MSGVLLKMGAAGAVPSYVQLHDDAGLKLVPSVAFTAKTCSPSDETVTCVLPSPLLSGPGHALNAPWSSLQTNPVVVSSRPSQLNDAVALFVKGGGVPMNAGGDSGGPVGVVSMVQS